MTQASGHPLLHTGCSNQTLHSARPLVYHARFVASVGVLQVDAEAYQRQGNVIPRTLTHRHKTAVLLRNNTRRVALSSPIKGAPHTLGVMLVPTPYPWTRCAFCDNSLEPMYPIRSDPT